MGFNSAFTKPPSEDHTKHVHLVAELVLNMVSIQRANFINDFQPQANAFGIMTFFLKAPEKFFAVQGTGSS